MDFLTIVKIPKWLLLLKEVKNCFQAGNKLCFTELYVSDFLCFPPENKVLVYIAVRFG